MKKQRKHYTPEEKVAILRRHLLEQEPISRLCDELGLQPTVFYRWQKEFFENGAAAFQQKARPNHPAEQERIAYLEKKIQTKDEVLAELMAEYAALKKRFGNSDRGLGSARLEGYRKLTFMMLDADIVAVSPSSVESGPQSQDHLLPAIS